LESEELMNIARKEKRKFEATSERNDEKEVTRIIRRCPD
jgi:hypothetical protein